MATLKSPRPAPKFFTETQTFSTKKSRNTPREQVPPRPPAKSVQLVSRFFPNQIRAEKAQAVSFRDSESSILSKHYDEDSKELYFDQCFTVEGKIGAGSFGEVFRVKSKEDGQYYAVKRSMDRFKGESDRRRKLEEVAKHEQLPKHPNCIRFVKAWEEHQHLYIQTELCETSLNNYCEVYHDIPETLIWNYFIDLLQALKNLHSHDLIHMDIKPANIFISSDGICKLGDFGLVLDLKKVDTSEASEGDPKYLAPELLEGKFTKAADIFSLGITVLELASDLDLPCGGEAWHRLRHGCIPSELLSKISSDLQYVIKLMMDPDYRKRPTIDTILNFPAVKRILKRRRWQLRLKLTMNRIYDVYNLIANFCNKLWSSVTVLYSHLHKKISHQNVLPSVSQTPKKRHPSEWDYSFSDDECFEEDGNATHQSTSKQTEDPSMSEESKTENSFESDNERVINSTPSRYTAKKSRICSTNTTPMLDWDSYRYSPKYSFSSMSPIHARSPFMLDEEFAKMITGPKNLTEVFNALANQSD